MKRANTRSAGRASSVFINCPFDPGYQPLFEALVFAVAYCGFRVRSALELVDSGELRLVRIIKMIEESAFSIHDISRVELDTDTDLPRFNMPIELGIAIGMKHSGRRPLRDHRLLVLDAAGSAKRFRYQSFASDLAGTDIRSHEGRPERIVTAVRDFLAPAIDAPVAHDDVIIETMAEFEQAPPSMARANKQRVEKLTFTDRYRHIATFIGRTA